MVPFSVIGPLGRRFVVKLVPPGERYGLHECKVNDRDEPMVEFYQASDEGQVGAFIIGYVMETFLQARGRGRGLQLWGEDPEMNLDAIAVEMAWRYANKAWRR